MPKTKEQKKEIFQGLKEQLENMKSVVFVNFLGLKVKDVEQLRKNCLEQEVHYVAAKKTLLTKALSETGHESLGEKGFEGEVAAVFGKSDEVAPAKIVYDFSKEHEEVKVLSGILDGEEIDSTKVVALAQLPSKPELLAKVVGSIASPLSGLVNVLQGNIRGLVYTLSAIKDKKTE